MTRRLPVSSAPPFNLGPISDEEWEAFLRTRLLARTRPAGGASPGVSAAPAPTPTDFFAAGVGVTPDTRRVAAAMRSPVEADPSLVEPGSVSGGRSSSRGTAGRHQT